MDYYVKIIREDGLMMVEWKISEKNIPMLIRVVGELAEALGETRKWRKWKPKE